MAGCSSAVADVSTLHPFTSDGCSLFPDGTIKERTRWCDCCFKHDIAYWQGGTEEERKKADAVLRDCVLDRTGDAYLANLMYAGVRVGGHPAFPVWYRWGYGWPYGRGYEPLTDKEKHQVREQFDKYTIQHPNGYCMERHGKVETTTPVSSRPAAWAIPLQADYLQNFHKIDAKVYRSAQPGKKGFAELKNLGIKSVLNLRDYHSDDEGNDFGLTLYRINMEAGDITIDKLVEALRIIKNAEGPILIHCWHGSDRTGLVSAFYRIVFQGWSKDEAIDELMHGGYGYHALYKNIPEFIRDSDVEEITRRIHKL